MPESHSVNREGLGSPHKIPLTLNFFPSPKLTTKRGRANCVAVHTSHGHYLSLTSANLRPQMGQKSLPALLGPSSSGRKNILLVSNVNRRLKQKGCSWSLDCLSLSEHPSWASPLLSWPLRLAVTLKVESEDRLVPRPLLFSDYGSRVTKLPTLGHG